MFECIESGERRLAMIFRAGGPLPERTTFLTPDELPFQAGFVVYPRGAEIPRHEHKPLERQVTGTSELLLVRRGRCEVDLYDDARALVATRTLEEGDLILLSGGGHGFRLLEDTVLLEVKQGPYQGDDEKVRF